MVTYLKRKGYPEDLIKDTIEFLKQKNLVDDLNFSKRWIENRSLLKPSSINKLKLELRQKHINREIINQVLSESPIDEVAVLKEIILKKQKLAKYQDKQTMMMFLARKGFSYDSIKKVLSDIGDSSS
jgi:regulatory protein